MSLRICFLLLFMIGASKSLPAQIFDRIAALVEDEVITLSDLLWHVKYRGLRVPEEPDKRKDFYSSILNQRISQVLIMRETEKTPFISVRDDELTRFFESYKSQFSSEGDYSFRLSSMGMGEDDLLMLLKRQLTINKFVEMRFEPFIIVLPGEIEAFYQDEFLQQLANNGQPAPDLELVEETIRQILTVRKTTEELERWVENTLSSAKVVILLDQDQSLKPNVPRVHREEITFQPLDIQERR